MTKIVFMGTPAFSVPILEGLLEQGYDIQAVVTQPDRPVGRKRVLTPPPVKEAALKYNLEVLQPEKITKSPELERIAELKPDLIITAAFGQFLPTNLLAVPRLGAYNVHASLLPKYRGGAPVHYALIKGELETGISIIEMVKKMDAGDIYSQKSISIEETDDVGSMFDKLSLLGRDLLLETLPALIKGEISPVKQDEALVTFSPNITREEERIDWTKTATDIHNKVRGMHPWPVAYTMFNESRWKIWQAKVSSEKTKELPGTIVSIEKDYFSIACGAGTVLKILRLQPAGRGQLSAEDYLNGVGQDLEIGEKVE